MKWILLTTIVMIGALDIGAQLPNGINSDLRPDVPAFKVRPGYRVTRALPAKKIKNTRFLQFSEDGKTLFVSSREEGIIYSVKDPDADGMYQTVTPFVKNKRSVQGMDVHDGWLYFQQPSEGSLSRARDTNGDGVADDVEVVLPPHTFPTPGNHPYNAV